MSETYRVRVSKDYLVFSAAHFITFNGNICERLHGHNYQVEAELEGALDENHYVIDFIALRDHLKNLVDELDHHVLLPTDHPQIHVTAGEREVEATFEDRRWVFPRGDCILLPVPNTTTELIARYLGNRLTELISADGLPQPTRMRIGVDENNGQWGEWVREG